jgi:hypothetical protein
MSAMTKNAADNSGLHGYDPLANLASASDRLLSEVAHRNIVNILKSYTGFYDLFSEGIQNAIDGLEARAAASDGKYQPQLWIDVDLARRSVRIVDNGCGMDQEQFKLCFAPNVSFKRDLPLRGQKGVGATFLAYGFSFIRLESKQRGTMLGAILRGGRLWSEDKTGKVPRPRFEEVAFDVPELSDEPSGTAVQIVLGNAPGERPQKLDWQGATTARQWLDVLRVKTPLGGIYLTSSPKPFQYSVTVSVTTEAGVTTEHSNRVDYLYPHDIPDIKTASLNDLRAALAKIKGDPATVQRKLPDDFKNLECLWEIWDADALALLDISEDDKALVARHAVVVYGAFVHSVRVWDYFNDEVLALRSDYRLLRGGLQMASDHMPQGDLITIPLKKAIGYQNNTHVIVHFTNGNPDLGRKTFQPEYHELAETLATKTVKMFTEYRNLVRPDTGAKVGSQDKALYEWRKEQEQWRDSHALVNVSPNITILSEPREEQDVIALFHQLVGAGVLKGLRFYSTKFNSKYDSLFETYYGDTALLYSGRDNPLGVSKSLDLPHTSAPMVLEYKYDLDAVVNDFQRDVKFIKHIDLLVCWTAADAHQSLLTLYPYLVGTNGSSRTVYGATHAAYRNGGGDEALFEVLILSDLLSFLFDSSAEQARQKTKYAHF